MNWFIRTLAGAVISGVGWKLGSDAYEVIKKRVQKKNGSAANSEEADKAGASITGAADGDGGDGDGDDTTRRPAEALA